MKLRRALRLPRSPGDSGSVVVALLVSLIVGGLVLVVGVAAISGQKAVRFDRDFTAVIAAAEAGVQEGLFRLNVAIDPVSPIPPATSTTACVAPLPTSQKCATGTVGGATFQWYAVKVAPREWDVHSSGVRNGRERTVVARMQENREFFASAFADLELDFNGGNVADTYNSGTASSAAFTPRADRLGIVGSNGNLRIPTGAPVDGVQLWNFAPTPASYTGPLPAPSNNLGVRCPQAAEIGLTKAAQYAAGTYDPPLPNMGVLDPPGGLNACGNEAQFRPVGDYPYQLRFSARRTMTPTLPQLLDRRARCVAAAGGLFNNLPKLNSASTPTLVPVTALGVPGFVTVPPTTSATGDFVPGYYCFRDIGAAKAVEFNGDFDVPTATLDNPVEMAVFGDMEVIGGGDQRVNCQPCVDDGDSKPIAGRLRIYMGPIDAAGTTFGAFRATSQKSMSFALAAPKSLCRGGAQNEFYGSLICGEIDNTGGWLFHYDAALQNIGNRTFGISSLQERS